MSLLQISEPNQSPLPHQKERYAVGIDLGTTHSLLAVVQSNTPKVLAINGATTVPSAVAFVDGQVVVGQAALAMADTAPSDTIVSAKRFMGRTLADIKFSHPYQLVGEATTMPDFVTSQGQVSPVAVSAHILQKLVRAAKSELTGELAGAVITVPAYFDEAQRQATLDAASACGIKVLRLINEPTAAALAYGLREQTVLVYDLGGGTFDVSVLTFADGVFDVQATGGNSALGGDDIDRLLGNFFIVEAGFDPKMLSAAQKSAIARQARYYKELLTTTDESVLVTIPELEFTYTLTNDKLREVIAPVIARTLASCRQVLDDARLQKDAIDTVILVGGSTRMPVIQAAVAEFFGCPPLSSLNPDEVVAMGAAILANQLLDTSAGAQVLLLDVAPLSLGLETMGGLVEVIIPRNTPIPITRRNEFTTHTDGQTGMLLHVVQGERELANDCRSLARFELYGIPPMKAGLARIEVTFALDVNGKLTVSAKETTTSVSGHVNVVPSSGLSSAQQEALLQDGFAYAKEDKATRALVETKLAAQTELTALQQALQEFAPLLGEQEQQQLEQAMQALADSLESDDKALIDRAKANLKPSSDYFAGLIMNQNVKHALTGTTASDWQ